MIGREHHQLTNPAKGSIVIFHGPFQPFGAVDPGHKETAETIDGKGEKSGIEKSRNMSPGLYIQRTAGKQARIDEQKNQCREPSGHTHQIIRGKIPLAHGVEAERVQQDTGEGIEDERGGQKGCGDGEKNAAGFHGLVFSAAEENRQQKNQNRQCKDHRVDIMIPVAGDNQPGIELYSGQSNGSESARRKGNRMHFPAFCSEKAEEHDMHERSQSDRQKQVLRHHPQILEHVKTPENSWCINAQNAGASSPAEDTPACIQVISPDQITIP